MNFMLHISLFIVLAVILVGVYIYRHWLENHDDHYIHLHNDSHDQSIISTQTVMGRKLDALEKIKNALWVAVIVYGLAIAAMGVYWAWTANS